MTSENMDRDSDQLQAQILAEQSGGRAFANTNGLSDVIDKITHDPHREIHIEASVDHER